MKLPRATGSDPAGVAIVAVLGIGFLASKDSAPLRHLHTHHQGPKPPLLHRRGAPHHAGLPHQDLRVPHPPANVSGMVRRLWSTASSSGPPSTQGSSMRLRRSSYLVFLFGLMIGLQWAGVNMSSLVILGGALGIGIGFGLQNIANNFVSGIVLLMERPIQVGDRVEVGHQRRRRPDRRAQHLDPYQRQRRDDHPELGIHQQPCDELDGKRSAGPLPVPLGVSYKSDPEVVRDVLRKSPTSTRTS